MERDQHKTTRAARWLLGVMFALSAAMPALTQEPSDSYRLGMAAFRAGEYGRAATLMERAEAEQPRSTDALLLRGQALLRLNLLKEAEAALRGYVEQHTASAEGHKLLGFVLYRETKAKESLGEYTQAARFETPGPEDLKIVSFDYVILADYPDADKWLTRVVDETPGDADAWYYLGRTKYNEDRLAEAIVAFTTCLKIEPANAKAETNLGLAYQGLNRIDEAKAAYETAIGFEANSEKRSAQPYLDIGILLMEQSHYSEALKYLQNAAQLAPQNPRVHEELGRSYEKTNKLQPAQAELEKAVQLAPNIPSLHFQLGMIYRREGNKESAKNEFDRCAQLNGTHSGEQTPNP